MPRPLPQEGEMVPIRECDADLLSAVYQLEPDVVHALAKSLREEMPDPASGAYQHAMARLGRALTFASDDTRREIVEFFEKRYAMPGTAKALGLRLVKE